MQKHFCDYLYNDLRENFLLKDAFRAQQLWEWVYCHGVNSFDDMSNIPKNLRQELQKHLMIARPKVVKELHADDGTIKWLFGYPKNTDESNLEEIETVLIPHGNRGTLCVSSQIGCTLSCLFCHTGTQPLVRNLSTSEIISQLLKVKDSIGDWEKEKRKITNIVFMGMGEPFLNYDAVANSIYIMSDENGLNISRKKITVSTSGIVPMIIRSASELKTKLAISLHAVHDELRNKLVPINKRYPIKELLQACQDYAKATNNERVTFEYVMLDGVNDSESDGRALGKLIAHLPAKVNLIPFNPWPGSGFKTSSIEKINLFAYAINKSNRNVMVTVRWPRGHDIGAACGQLKSLTAKEPKNRKITTNIEMHRIDTVD